MARISGYDQTNKLHFERIPGCWKVCHAATRASMSVQGPTPRRQQMWVGSPQKMLPPDGDYPGGRCCRESVKAGEGDLVGQRRDLHNEGRDLQEGGRHRIADAAPGLSRREAGACCVAARWSLDGRGSEGARGIGRGTGGRGVVGYRIAKSAISADGGVGKGFVLSHRAGLECGLGSGCVLGCSVREQR